MKILSFPEFAALPAGTVYSHYEPCACTGLFRKGESLRWDNADRDFYEACIQGQCHNGEHPRVDTVESRWGLYEYDAKFAVYEPNDIKTMMAMLSDGNNKAITPSGDGDDKLVERYKSMLDNPRCGTIPQRQLWKETIAAIERLGRDVKNARENAKSHEDYAHRMQEERHQIAMHCHAQDATIATLRAEVEDHERWFKEMVADYRLQSDDHKVSWRCAINGLIHDLRTELAAAKREAGERAVLQDTAEHDCRVLIARLNDIEQQLAALARQRDALVKALEDLIPLADGAMREANRDGAEYDPEEELREAKQALADARGE